MNRAMAIAVWAYLAAMFPVANARRLGEADLAPLFLRRARAAFPDE